METRRYKVTCLKCSGERRVKLVKGKLGTEVDWLEDGQNHPIISFRERLDSQYGWQCVCGNNDLMTDQEYDTIRNHAEPKPQEIKQIVKNLKVQSPKFKLVEI